MFKNTHFKGLFFSKLNFIYLFKKMRTAGLKMAFWRVLTTTKGKTKAKKSGKWAAGGNLELPAAFCKFAIGFVRMSTTKVLQTIKAKLRFCDLQPLC